MFASGATTPTGLKTPRTPGVHAEDVPILGADVEQGRTDYGTTRTRGESHVWLRYVATERARSPDSSGET